MYSFVSTNMLGPEDIECDNFLSYTRPHTFIWSGFRKRSMKRDKIKRPHTAFQVLKTFLVEIG